MTTTVPPVPAPPTASTGTAAGNPAAPDGALVAELAAVLERARAERRAVPPLTDGHPGLDLATGYAVQRLARSSAGPLAGYKLGVTSRAKQAQVGVDAPIYGYLPAAAALDTGEPLEVARQIQPRGEPEIVLYMGRDLAGPAVTAADVLRATDAVAVGIEVLDSRYQDYRFTIPDVVADNASAGRFVVGTPVPAAGIDLRLVGVVLEHRGEVVATASGAASLGHPAAAVAWLVRALAEHDEGLRAGDLVLSGGLTAAVPVVAGDTLVATVDRLGALELPCV
jgi:2-oxo-3-hexenedioate decarboxylase